MSTGEIRVGDWVQVWGQVKRVDQPGVHPEDVSVEFFSHNEQWNGHVRRDRVTKVEVVPPFVERCSSLHPYSALTPTGRIEAYVRCEMHEGHTGQHVMADLGRIEPILWETGVGYFEDA